MKKYLVLGFLLLSFIVVTPALGQTNNQSLLVSLLQQLLQLQTQLIQLLQQRGLQPITQLSTQPSITVLSPNGGENWSQNGKYTIRWAYSGLGLDKNDEISITLRSSLDYFSICSIGMSLIGQGSFDVVPGNVSCAGDSEIKNLKSGGKYIIQLLVPKYSEGRGVADTSDNYITITPQ